MSRRSLVLGSMAAVFTTLLISGCGTLAAGKPANVNDLIKSRPELSTLSGLIDKSGMGPALAAVGPFTVFAPSNEAFAKLPAARMAELAANPTGLKELLSQHVVAGTLEASTVGNGPVTTLAGHKLALSKAGNFVTIDEALVTTSDLKVSNGVVHVVDQVLPLPRK